MTTPLPGNRSITSLVQRSRSIVAIAVLLTVLPVAHPLLRPALGPPSHLLWFAQVFPVALICYHYGARGLVGALAIGVTAVVLGESTFGAGYGVPADTATVVSLGISVGLTELLVGGFALWVRLVEQQRSESERLAVSALAASHDAMLVLDRGKQVRYANPAAQVLFAQAQEQLEGCTLNCLLHEEVPDLDAFLVAAKDPRTVLAVTGTGRVFPANLRASPVTDSQGTITAWLVTARDRSAELVRERSDQRERALRELGAVVAGIAHELNNPLTSVAVYGEILAQSRTALPPDIAEVIDTLVHEGKRAAQIARNLLQKVRQGGPPRIELFDLNAVVREALKARAAQFAAHGISLVTELSDESLPVAGRRGEVEQVIANLLANAEDAMHRAHGRGRLSVSTRREEGTAVVIVHDDGPGIPAEVLPRIFEPFFTTKGEQGTGLGLAIARRIAREHDGSLEADNASSGGARFTLRLPLHAEASVEPQVSQVVGGPPHRDHQRPRVLVIDDEPAIRGALQRLLGGLGYDVVLAQDFATAAACVEAERFDAILCDAHLPDGSGLELYRLIAARQPELTSRFVLMTGDVLGAEVAAFLGEPQRLHLAKPFELADVLRVLDGVLGVSPRDRALQVHEFA